MGYQPSSTLLNFSIDQSTVHAPTINNTNPIGNAPGCVTTDTFQWAVNALPEPLLSGDQAFCSGNPTVVLKV